MFAGRVEKKWRCMCGNGHVYHLWRAVNTISLPHASATSRDQQLFNKFLHFNKISSNFYDLFVFFIEESPLDSVTTSPLLIHFFFMFFTRKSLGYVSVCCNTGLNYKQRNKREKHKKRKKNSYVTQWFSLHIWSVLEVMVFTILKKYSPAAIAKVISRTLINPIVILCLNWLDMEALVLTLGDTEIKSSPGSYHSHFQGTNYNTKK